MRSLKLYMVRTGCKAFLLSCVALAALGMNAHGGNRSMRVTEEARKSAARNLMETFVAEKEAIFRGNTAKGTGFQWKKNMTAITYSDPREVDGHFLVVTAFVPVSVLTELTGVSGAPCMPEKIGRAGFSALDEIGAQAVRALRVAELDAKAGMDEILSKMLASGMKNTLRSVTQEHGFGYDSKTGQAWYALKLSADALNCLSLTSWVAGYPDGVVVTGRGLAEGVWIEEEHAQKNEGAE